MDKAVHGHQNSVDGNGVLPADGQQHHVHDDGGHPPGDVVQKAGQPAGDDLPQGLGVEPGPHEPQLHLPQKEGDKGRDGGEGHAQAAAQGRAPDADFQHAHKQQLQAHAGHGHEDVQDHAAADLPANAQVIVHGKDNGGHRGAEGVGNQILSGLVQQLPLGAHPGEEGPPAQGQHRPGKDPRQHHHNAGAGEVVVGLFLILAAQLDGDGHRAAQADQVRQGKVDDDQGHGQVESRKGGVPQNAADENAVSHLVQG